VRLAVFSQDDFFVREDEMRLRRLALCIPVLWIRHALAQPPDPRFTPDVTCSDGNQAIVDKVEIGQLAEAEAVASRVLTIAESNRTPSCLWIVLHNMAAVKALSGRLAEAEVLEDQSLKILDTIYSRDDRVRLRPLRVLWSVQLRQGKRGEARQTFRAMRSLRLKGPQDQAVFYSTSAAQLQAEGQPKEAEAEYLRALAAWRDVGRGDTAGVAALLISLGSLQIDQDRFLEAAQSLDRALAIVQSARDAVPMDLIDVLRVRATLNARQGKWQAAAEDQGSAISMSDRFAQLDPADQKRLLSDFAYILRKAHRSNAARSVEARAKAIHLAGSTKAVVDVSELVDSRKKLKK
jgi:tetratricopeptide (TPR) repeat protein